MMKKKQLLIPSAALALFAAPGFYNGLTVRHYMLTSEKLSDSIRIAQLSDHHSCRYGKKQESLLAAIGREAPDIILMTGDIFDDRRDNIETEYLLQGLADRYPCYYVTGNHEYWTSKETFSRKMNLLEKHGVHILHGETEKASVKGEILVLAGVDDPDKVLDFHHRRWQSTYTGNLPAELNVIEKDLDTEYFTILLSHRPELFELYASHSFDLVLSGHAHGGQWRFPWTQNGLYAPHQGLFPKYSGGSFTKNGTTMIVSRGLARESTIIPRIYNPPELVIIDISGSI